MAENEYTTKFNIDITDLKNGIQQANQLIKLANSEFKAATGGMDNWENSADGLNAKLKQLESVLGAQKAKMEVLRAEYDRVVKSEGENSKGAQDLQIKMNNLQGEIGKTESQITKYSNKLNDVQKGQNQTNESTEKSANAYDKLKQKISEQESELDKLKNTYAAVVLEQGKNSEEAQRLAGEIQGLSSELGENKNKLSEAEQAANELDDTLDDVGNNAEKAENGFTILKGALANLVADGIRMAIDGLKNFAKESIQVGANFDSAMSEVAAISGATGDELALLRETAKEFGESTVFSASESADALKYMALAGWNTQQSVDALGGVLNLAAASGMGLADASNMVTSYLTAFGMEAKDSTYFADMLAYAQSNSSTTAEELGEAYKNCAANLNAAGQDVETTTSLLAMMANQGHTGAQAGTALSAAMRDLTAKMSLVADETELAKYAQDGFISSTGDLNDVLGRNVIAINDTLIPVSDANGNFRDMTDILKDVETATNGMGNAERAAALASTFTSDSIKGLNDILAAGVDKAANFEEELRNANGTSSEMSEIMNDNLNGDLKALGSKLEGVQIKLYEKFEPALRSGVEILSKLLDAVKFVVEHLDGFIPVIAGVATAFGILAGAIAIQGIIGMVTKAFAFLNITLLANPILLIVAAIAGLVTALVVLWNKSDAFREFWAGLWEGIKSVASNVVDALIKFFTETIPNAWSGFLEFCSTFISNVVKSFAELPLKIGIEIGKAIAKIIDWGLNLVTKAKEIGSNFLDAIISFFIQLPEKIGMKISEVITKITDWGSNLITKAKEIGSNFLDSIISFFIQLPLQIGMEISEVITKIIYWGLNLVAKAKEIGSNFLDAIVSFFIQLPLKIGTEIGEVMAKIIDWGLNLVTKAKEIGYNFLTTIVSFFTQLPGKILEFITNALNNVNTWSTNMVNKAKETGTQFLQNIVNFFTQLPGKVTSFLSNVISVVTSWASNMATKAHEAGSNFLNNIINIITQLPGKISDLLSNIISNLSNWVTNMASKGTEGARQLFNNVVDGLRDLPNRVLSIGGDIVRGVWEGIRDATGWLGKKIRGFARDIIDDMKDALRIGSPSKVMADKIGKWIPAGVAEGIEKNAKSAVGAAKNLAEKLTPTMETLKTDMSGSFTGSNYTNSVSANANSNASPNTVVFNQYNNSPKALSRLEIYRQTRNQLAFAREV